MICMHGMVVDCQAKPDFIEDLTRPFKLYRGEGGSPTARIEVIEEEPPYASFPNLRATYSTPRNMVYRNEELRVVDYFGKGAIVEERRSSTFKIYSVDRNLLSEAFYLLVVSLFGQHCDRAGLLRIHTLALSYRDTAILLPIPPGGGKSTLGLAMIEDDDFRLLSEDEVVYDGKAIHPLHLRIGTLNEAVIREIPKEFVYQIDRMEFGLKYFVDIDYWDQHLEQRSLTDCMLVTAQRLLNGQPSITPSSRRKSLRSLVRDAVVGIGLYQGLEFILHHPLRDVISKGRIAGRRYRLARRLAARSRSYRFMLSRDLARNVDVFRDFIRKNV